MKPFVLFATVLVIVNARPEAGYNYPSPQGNRFQGGGNIGYTTGSSSFVNGGYSQSSQSGLSLGGGYVNGGYSQGSQFNGQVNNQIGYQSQGGVQVHKHVYVHVAPEEPEEVQRQSQIQAGVRQKHYKIIFIKAPSYQSHQQIIAQQNALKEEKTLVYVLVKKPDALADVNIPAQAQAPINKPEVYFIKYKSQKDGISGINNIGGVHANTGINSGSLYGAPVDSGISGSSGLNIGSSSSSSGSFTTGGILNGGIASSTKYGPPGYQK